ncbi:MAG: hypothetical protein M1282_00175 [Chloroflexi bacterium]|nr:hypothetical protein [Chloroflexota bacterium]
MLTMSFLQEGPNTSLVWLFYVLLAFLLLVIVVGALTSREEAEPVSGSEIELDRPILKQGSSEKVKRSSKKRKSK